MIDCEFENGGKARLRHAVAEAIVVKGGKVLLAKRSLKLTEPNKWAIPGGFMDRDETIVHAVRREVLEETGWTIKEPTLFCIIDNPNRPNEDRQNIAFLFIAEAGQQSGEADEESSEVRWFELNNLPSDDQMAFDHAEDIKLYKKWLMEKFALPVVG